MTRQNGIIYFCARKPFFFQFRKKLFKDYNPAWSQLLTLEFPKLNQQLLSSRAGQFKAREMRESEQGDVSGRVHVLTQVLVCSLPHRPSPPPLPLALPLSFSLKLFIDLLCAQFLICDHHRVLIPHSRCVIQLIQSWLGAAEGWA